MELLSDAPDEVIAATATLALVAASALTGLVFLAAGVFRLGELARYVPYPVFAGFLGAVGLLIVLGALQMAVPTLRAPTQTSTAYWVGALGLGLALLASTRVWRGRATLPLAIRGAHACPSRRLSGDRHPLVQTAGQLRDLPRNRLSPLHRQDYKVVMVHSQSNPP